MQLHADIVKIDTINKHKQNPQEHRILNNNWEKDVFKAWACVL